MAACEGCIIARAAQGARGQFIGNEAIETKIDTSEKHDPAKTDHN